MLITKRTTIWRCVRGRIQNCFCFHTIRTHFVMYLIAVHLFVRRTLNVLRCTILCLYRTVSYCTALYCTMPVSYCTVLYCTALYYTMPVSYCTVLYCTVRSNPIFLISCNAFQWPLTFKARIASSQM